jgi:hypothetical protein
VDRIADFIAGKIDDHFLGDAGRIADQLELMANDVEHAATRQTRRFFLVPEVDGDIDVDGAVLADPEEVDVQRPVGDRVELHILRQRPDLAAFDVDHCDGVHEVAGGQGLDQGLLLEVDRNGFLPVAVNDGRHSALTANGAGGSLASPLARLSRQRKLFAHVIVSKSRNAKRPASRLQG